MNKTPALFRWNICGKWRRQFIVVIQCSFVIAKRFAKKSKFRRACPFLNRHLMRFFGSDCRAGVQLVWPYIYKLRFLGRYFETTVESIHCTLPSEWYASVGRFSISYCKTPRQTINWSPYRIEFPLNTWPHCVIHDMLDYTNQLKIDRCQIMHGMPT